ncbi:MAG: DUF4189 domain-containing protein [Gammaproteobacteria bacterium]
MSKLRITTLASMLAAATLVAACGDDDDTYGAIAFSHNTTRAAIVAGGWTQSEANEEARDRCDARDCTVVLQFRDCGALSAGTLPDGRLVIGVAEGRSTLEAQTAANNACTTNGGSSCRDIPGLPPRCN